MSRSILRRMAVAVLACAALAEAAPAQAPRGTSGEAELLRRRVVLLEDRVVTLERRIAALEEALQARPEAGATRPGPTYLELGRMDGWRTRENWRLLRRGLSQIEVRYLLGAPGGLDAGDLFTTWYYPDPRGGRVRFDALGGRVESWSEPW